MIVKFGHSSFTASAKPTILVLLLFAGCERGDRTLGRSPTPSKDGESQSSQDMIGESTVESPAKPSLPVVAPIELPVVEVASDETVDELLRLGAKVTRNDDGFYVIDVRRKPSFLNDAIDTVNKCPGLIDLTLEQVAISDEGLSKLDGLLLQRLILNDSPITGAGIATLAKLPLRDTVFSFGFRNLAIRDDDVKVLSEFPRLGRIDLSGTEITDACIPTLSKLRLMMLNITGTSLTPEGVKQLRQALPQTEVRYETS